MFKHSPWPRCKERGMLYVQAVSFLAVEKGLLFPWQTGNIFGPELVRIYSIRRIFNFCCAASRTSPPGEICEFLGPPWKLHRTPPRKTPRETPRESTRDTARVHGRLRTGNRLPPQKKPYVFNLVFELYINFSELYIKWSRTIYKFLRTIYKNSGKFRDFRGNRTGSRGKVCERENTPLNSTRLTDSTQKTIQNIILGGLVDSWRWNQ